MESAAEYYAAAIEADPQHTKALYNLALTHFQLKNYGKTEVALEKLFQLNPADTAAYELYGHTQLQQGHASRAVECFNLLLQYKPTDARFVHRAMANIRTRHTNDALHDFDEALRLNPQNFEASLGKGIVLMELEQPKLAAAWLEKALSIRHGDAAALTNLGIIKYQLGEKTEAMEAFREALWSSRQGETFLARARCYLLDHNYSDAIADAREAMLIDGDNAEVYAFIGDVEADKGILNDAIESFGIAIDINPSHTNYYLRRAGACIKANRCHDAVADLYRALDLEPYNPEARALLQTAYRHIDADVMGESLSKSRH